MCRLAALPPFTSRQEALSILLAFEGQHNRDGVGSGHIDPETGQFVVVKYPHSLSKVVAENLPFLSHMPHPGWTIAHLRAASHGGNTMENTHPFVVGGVDGSGADWCICHNGIWSDHRIAKVILKAARGVQFQGETDTEVACQMINLLGPDGFYHALAWGGGVYLALNRDGTLWVVKGSGSLEAVERDRVVGKGKSRQTRHEAIFASTLDWQDYKDRREMPLGWYHLSADCHKLGMSVASYTDPIEEARRDIIRRGGRPRRRDYDAIDGDFDFHRYEDDGAGAVPPYTPLKHPVGGPSEESGAEAMERAFEEGFAGFPGTSPSTPTSTGGVITVPRDREIARRAQRGPVVVKQVANPPFAHPIKGGGIDLAAGERKLIQFPDKGELSVPGV